VIPAEEPIVRDASKYYDSDYSDYDRY